MSAPDFVSAAVINFLPRALDATNSILTSIPVAFLNFAGIDFRYV